MRLIGSKKNLALSNPPEVRKAMAEPDNKRISLTRQAYLLTVNRSSLYRQPPTAAWSQLDLDDMRMIDAIYTAHPYYGYRKITAQMRLKGRQINRKRVRRLMQIMGIQGICPGPNLSKRLHANTCTPSLRGLNIRPDQLGSRYYIHSHETSFMYLFVILTVQPLHRRHELSTLINI